MLVDAHFIKTARDAFTPFSTESGTEHVALLLYSIVRMTRPTVCIEYGSGYSTLFILAALAENDADIRMERELLRVKTSRLGDLGRFYPHANNPVFRDWLDQGGLACGVDPEFFQHPRGARLYSIEGHSSAHEYVTRMKRAVHQLGLDSFFSHVTGAPFSTDTLPTEDQRIDLAWNDANNYQEFFETIWPRLNPNGGLLIFHNTMAVERHWSAVEWMRNNRKSQGDLEEVSFFENHKLNQNSCTIFRRVDKRHPALFDSRISRVKQNLIRFMRMGDDIKPVS